MKTVEVTSEDVDPPDWLPDLTQIISRASELLTIENYEVGILLCSEARIERLNHEYRGIDAPTDVLTFSQADDEGIPALENQPQVAGDIVLSLDSVAENARAFGVPIREEAMRVTVHGLMHLSGHEHGEAKLTQDNAADPMLMLQERIVAELMKENIE